MSKLSLSNKKVDTILVLDFGSQYTQLIARRVRESNVYSEILPWDIAESKITELKPKGIILSGGPNSVTETFTPRAPQVVFDLGIPILGICVGMQLMASSSKEGKEKGLNWFKADNLHLSSIMDSKEKVPHIGWNQIEKHNSALFKDIEKPTFYFLHSYFINPTNHSEIDAYADYGGKFPCAVSKNKNIFGVQFHPEKSHNCGIKVLENFSKIEV